MQKSEGINDSAPVGAGAAGDGMDTNAVVSNLQSQYIAIGQVPASDAGRRRGGL
jgi:hypothetical protein